MRSAIKHQRNRSVELPVKQSPLGGPGEGLPFGACLLLCAFIHSFIRPLDGEVEYGATAACVNIVQLIELNMQLVPGRNDDARKLTISSVTTHHVTAMAEGAF